MLPRPVKRIGHNSALRPRPPAARRLAHSRRPTLFCALMIPLRCKQIEVYLFRRRAGRIELLVLRRARGRPFAGVWQPVTGRIRRGERPSRAATREVREETKLVPHH